MDKVYMREVELYAENNSELYRQRFIPIINNIKRKIKSRKYNPALAPKLWRYYYDDAAKRYVKEFGGSLLGTKERQELANEKAVEEYDKIINGEYGPIEMKSNPVKRDKEISGYYLMSGYGKSAQSVGWYKTKEEAEKVATQLNYRGGTHYFVEPSYKRNPVKRYGSRAKFKHKRLVSPKKFAKKSLRTIKRGKKRIIVGCPKGKYDAKRKICRVGTRAQAVLTPKKNPKETLYFIHAKSKKGMGLNNGLYNEDRNSLTDKKEDATHFHDKNSANIIKRNLELQYKNWIWKVVPITFFEA